MGQWQRIRAKRSNRMKGEQGVNPNMPESMMPWLRGHAGAGHVAPTTPELTVGEVSALVGVSVRTLHHWDSIGVVQPRSRTFSGYRAYSAADVQRIHRVLVYRELGFSLTTIASILDDPDIDETLQLHQQQDLLKERISRLQQMAEALEKVLDSRSSGRILTAQEQAQIFGQGWREEWADEAWDRWGASDQWAQFERNASQLSKSDRLRIQENGQALYAELAEAKRSGTAPGSTAANLLAEQHRAMVSQLFECTHSMHVCLGQLYTRDERFSSFFAEVEPGLAEWLGEAINANARRCGVDPDHAVWE